MNPADNESDRLETAIRMHEAGRLTAASDLYEALTRERRLILKYSIYRAFAGLNSAI